MNYIELINHFWELDEKWQFSCSETRLYFYLLKTCNRLCWNNDWAHSDDRTAINVGISKNVLKTARKRLCEAELIAVVPGGNGHGVKTRYRILSANQTLKTSAKPKQKEESIPDSSELLTEEPAVKPKKKSKAQPLNKQKETKQKKEEKGSGEFTPPSVDEIKAYCLERKNGINAEKFFHYYAARGWKMKGSPMVEWQAAVQLWELRSRHEPAEKGEFLKTVKDERW